MKKKMLGVLGLLILLASFGNRSPVMAASSKGVETTLLKRGYPQEILDLMPEDMKKDVFAGGGTYSGHKVEIGNLTEDGFVPVPMGELHANTLANFSHFVLTSHLGSYGSKHYYQFHYGWTWDYNPWFNLIDKFGLAWSDDWSGDPSTAQWSYTAEGKNSSGQRSEKHWSGYAYHHWELKSGVGWDFDIRDGFVGPDGKAYIVDKNRGWGRINADHPYISRTEPVTTEVLGRYFHAEVNCSGGTLVFGKEPSIEISCTGTHDPSGPSVSRFDWYK